MKKKKSFNLKKIILIIIIILSILLVVLLLIESSLIDYIRNINKELRLIQIKDECNLFMNTILHPIQNEEQCKIKCNDECNLRKMNFIKVEFTENDKDCNICNCYCK